MNRMQEINRKLDEQKKAKLTAMGLPEYFPENNLDHIICGMAGKAILCRSKWGYYLAESLTDLLSKQVEHHTCEIGSETVAYFTAGSKLTVPERHTVQTMARYFETHTPGLNAEYDHVHIPSGLNAFGAPICFAEETDAYEAAEVLEVVTSMSVDVVQADEGHAVVVHDPSGDLSSYSLALIMGACAVLECFTCTRRDKATVDADLSGDCQDWQIGIGQRYMQLQRIEQGIQSILESVSAPSRSRKKALA